MLYALEKNPENKDELIEAIRKRGIGFELTDGLRSLTTNEKPQRRRTAANSGRIGTAPPKSDGGKIARRKRSGGSFEQSARSDSWRRSKKCRILSSNNKSRVLPLMPERIIFAISTAWSSPSAIAPNGTRRISEFYRSTAFCRTNPTVKTKLRRSRRNKFDGRICDGSWR